MFGSSRDLDWQNEALCAEIGLDAFFAEDYDAAKLRETKKVCERCTVRQDCLNWIMDVEGETERFGIFGGMSANERRKYFHMRQEEFRRIPEYPGYLVGRSGKIIRRTTGYVTKVVRVTQDGQHLVELRRGDQKNTVSRELIRDVVFELLAETS